MKRRLIKHGLILTLAVLVVAESVSGWRTPFADRPDLVDQFAGVAGWHVAIWGWWTIADLLTRPAKQRASSAQRAGIGPSNRR